MEATSNDFEHFSLAPNESDVTSTAQSYWEISVEFRVSEELVSVDSLFRTVMGENTFKEVEKLLSVQPEVECDKT